MSGIKLVIEGNAKEMLDAIPEALQPTVIRNLSRPVANKIVSMARKLFVPRETGVTRRTIGLLRVKNPRQKFVEVGVKGRSLLYIFVRGAIRNKGHYRGQIRPIGDIINQAADSVGPGEIAKMKVDLVKVIQRAFRLKRK